MGGDYFALCLALEELARVDSSVAITLEAGVSLGAMPIYRFGTEEQKQRVAAPAVPGEVLGAFGLTEPGGGSDAGATRTTARLEGDEWVINGSKAFITNSGTDITALVTVTAVTGARTRRPQGDLGDHRAVRHAGLHGVAEVLEGRLELPPTPASCPSTTVRVPEENLLGRAGPRLRAVPLDPRRGPHRDRGAVGRARAGLRRRVVRYARERRGVRPPDRQLPGDPVQDRRHGGAGAHRAAGLLPRGGEDAARRAVQEGGGDRQAGRLERGDGQRPRRHPGLRRLRVHERVSRSAASTATRRSWRSARAPPRSRRMLIARDLGL